MDVVEPVGEQSFVYVTLESGPQVAVAVPGRTAIRDRTAVDLRLPRDTVHLFDAATGRALHHPEWTQEESLTGLAPGRSDG